MSKFRRLISTILCVSMILTTVLPSFALDEETINGMTPERTESVNTAGENNFGTGGDSVLKIESKTTKLVFGESEPVEGDQDGSGFEKTEPENEEDEGKEVEGKKDESKLDESKEDESKAVSEEQVSEEPESKEDESAEPESTKPESTKPESTEAESTEAESFESESIETESTEHESSESEKTENEDNKSEENKKDETKLFNENISTTSDVDFDNLNSDAIKKDEKAGNQDESFAVATISDVKKS